MKKPLDIYCSNKYITSIGKSVVITHDTYKDNPNIIKNVEKNLKDEVWKMFGKMVKTKQTLLIPVIYRDKWIEIPVLDYQLMNIYNEFEPVHDKKYMFEINIYGMDL